MEGKNSLPQGLDNSEFSLNKLTEFLKKIGFKLKNIKDINFDNTYIKDINFKKILAIFMIVTMTALGYTGYKVNEIKTRAFDVYLGEEKIGSVRTEEEAFKIIKEVKSDLSNEYGASIVLDKDIRLEPTHTKDEQIISSIDFKNSIKSKVGFVVSAYVIKVDGEEIGALKSQREAEYIINKIKEPFLKAVDKNSKIKEVKILEDVQIVKKEVPINKINKQDELIKYIKTGSEEIKTHTVEVGESFWTIAKIYGTTVEELELANADKDPTKLKPGDEIKLLMPTSKITIATVEEVEYRENV